jgi:endonuclease/exonuclease/phosphatase family metal-dependent hydrolase
VTADCRQTAGERAPRTVRVATWNIHSAVGCDLRRDLDRIIAEIRSWDADIVALQEVDSRGLRDCTFKLLQQGLGGYCVDARAITAQDGDYGQLLASRWPFSTSCVHDISVPDREPRRAIEAYVETPWGALQVVAAHLGLSFAERATQAQRLIEIAGPRQQTTVVLGDFNDWIRAGSVQRALAADFPDRSEVRTFPSPLPLLKLDRIYCRPAGVLSESRAVGRAWRMSDHLPLLAELRMPAAEDYPRPRPLIAGRTR